MDVIRATAKLASTSIYSQSKWYSIDSVPKNGNETNADYEKRTWRNRMHSTDGTDDGNIFIPAMSFKLALQSAAKYLGMQIPGQGKKTYTKKFEAGIMIMDDVILPYTRGNVEGQWLHLPSDGQPGGTKRVPKCFGIIPEWKADLEIVVLDNIITEEVLEKHLEVAGQFIGIGFWRPERRGMWGRFRVQGVKYAA